MLVSLSIRLLAQTLFFCLLLIISGFLPHKFAINIIVLFREFSFSFEAHPSCLLCEFWAWKWSGFLAVAAFSATKLPQQRQLCIFVDKFIWTDNLRVLFTKQKKRIWSILAVLKMCKNYWIIIRITSCVYRQNINLITRTIFIFDSCFENTFCLILFFIEYVLSVLFF